MAGSGRKYQENRFPSLVRMSRKVLAILKENVFSGLVNLRANECLQSTGTESLPLTCLSKADFSTHLYQIFDTPEALRTKGNPPDGRFIREATQQLPRRVLPTFLHGVYHRSCFLQHSGVCLPAASGSPAAPRSPWQPQGLRGWILPNTLPLSETPLGELGIGKKGVRTTDAHLCRVILRPSSLQQTRLELTSCSLCVHVQ